MWGASSLIQSTRIPRYVVLLYQPPRWISTYYNMCLFMALFRQTFLNLAWEAYKSLKLHLNSGMSWQQQVAEEQAGTSSTHKLPPRTCLLLLLPPPTCIPFFPLGLSKTQISSFTGTRAAKFLLMVADYSLSSGTACRHPMMAALQWCFPGVTSLQGATRTMFYPPGQTLW